MEICILEKGRTKIVVIEQHKSEVVLLQKLNPGSHRNVCSVSSVISILGVFYLLATRRSDVVLSINLILAVIAMFLWCQLNPGHLLSICNTQQSITILEN